MRYRVFIQNRSDGDKYIASIPFESEEKNIPNVIKKIKKALKKEITEREKLLAETPDDLIDWNSKGSDISKEEFLENEMWFDRYT